MAERTLTDQEMIDILEDIARSGGNAAARIAAIKALRDIAAGESGIADGFGELDELASKRQNRPQAA